MPPTPRALIDQNLRLFSLPAIALRLNEMVDDPGCTAAQIGEEIARDPGLTARLLRIVNSPIYRFPSAIDSIPMAITILGTRQLRDLVLATSVFQTFKDVGQEEQEMEVFWRHSITCAVAAKEIAHHLKLGHGERLFVAGLLHDIGKLVMLSALRHEYHQLVERLQETAASSHGSVEREIFGFDHSDIGGELLSHWNLPESLVEPVSCHHRPQRATRYRSDTYIVHLANQIANELSPVISRDDNPVLVADTLPELTLDGETVAAITETVRQNQPTLIELLYPVRGASSA
ncbi:MAG TPA: HDOD domain-containing protein [Gammaproteobacteria bacterium]|nr:HDOD domain-containing protein [Gammaproteobacteria bacterium]